MSTERLKVFITFKLFTDNLIFIPTPCDVFYFGDIYIFCIRKIVTLFPIGYKKKVSKLEGYPNVLETKRAYFSILFSIILI